MTMYLDKKYINLVSPSLPRFKWKKETLANCRCPMCGDSEVNENKARGYFFRGDDAYFYKCHNCGFSCNIYKFLEVFAPVLFKQYCLEKFIDKDKREEFVPKFSSYSPVSSKPKFETIDELPTDHKAVDFLNKRKIPKEHWNKFGYTSTFGTLARQVNDDYRLLEDERILIPIYNEHNQFIGVQGRSFGNIKPKYITLKKDESIKLTYGLERIDKSKRIFVVEGPIDSLFLPNAIACLGIGNFLEIREQFPNQDLVFVVDNEPRNRTVVDTIRRLIENGEKVCIFPSHVKDKDINDMVLKDVNVYDTIVDHTFSGPAAMLAFNSWRKC